MEFTPDVCPPIDDQQLAHFLNEQLRKISVAFGETRELDMRSSTRQPTRPREGMLIYADGTAYNPGFGRGTYQRGSAGWEKLARIDELPFFFLETYGGGTGASAATNTTAFGSAKAAAVAAGGGVIRLRGGTYQINALPSMSDSGVHIQGAGVEASVLKFMTQGASSGIGCLDWKASLGTTYTLSSDASEGTHTIVLTSASGLSVGDDIFIKGVSRPTTPNFPVTFITRIVAISGSTLTIYGLLPHKIKTSDTYTIAKFNPIRGGGIRDLTIDPSSISNAGTGEYIVRLENVKGMVFDNISILNFPGPTSTGSHIYTVGAYQSQFTNIRSTQSSSLSLLQYYNECTACFFDNIYAEGAQVVGTPIFGGSGLFSSCYCQFGKQISKGSMSRGVKHSGNIFCTFQSIEVTTSGYDTLANGVCLSAHYFCSFGTINSNGAAVASLWIANQEGFFQSNTIGEIVAANGGAQDLLVSPVTSFGGGSGNVIGSLIARVVTNAESETYMRIMSYNGAPHNFGTFAVDRNGSDQTGATGGAENKIQFNHALYNPSGFFDTATNYRYTPTQAGWYFISLNVAATDEAADAVYAVIYKNGAAYAIGGRAVDPGVVASSCVNVLVQLNGSSDYIEGFAYLPATITTIKGTVTRTFMHGHCVAPV